MSNPSYRISRWSVKELWRYVSDFLSPAVIISLYLALATSSHFSKVYFWDKKRCIIVQCSFYSLFFTQLHFKSFYQQPTVVSVPVNIPLDFKSFYFLKSFLYLFVNEHWLGSLQGKTSTSMISSWGIIITALAGILLALVSITVGLSVAVSYLKTLNQTQSSSLHFCRGNQKRAR